MVPVTNNTGKLRPTVNPVYLRKAVDKFGAQHVANVLGFSASSIDAMLTKRKCQKVTEFAAKSLLDPNDKQELVFVQCPKSDIEFLTRLLDGQNFKYRRFVTDM